MNTFLRDLRYAWRMLLRKPGFTALTVTTLALGIGLNTAVFSAIDALLLRPLPGTRAPDELVQLYRQWPGLDYGSNSVPHWRDVRERGRDVFTDAAAWNFEFSNLSADGRTQQVMSQMVSANFFSVLGVTPEAGRFFLPEEDVGEAAHPVVVVSHAAWVNTFGGERDIVGRTVILNGRSYTIVGVAPPEFKGPIPIVTPYFWVPLMQIRDIAPGRDGIMERRGDNFLNIIARVKPGVTMDQVRARLQLLEQELLGEYTEEYRGSHILMVPQSEAGVHPSFRGAQVGISAVIMAVVAMLLLIACVNVANLFLARARDRWREIALRLSIGARRSEIVRQLLTESLLFALVSGAAGLLVANVAIALANRVELPLDVPFNADLRLSVPVLLFTLAVSVAVGVLFGIAPALQATRPSLIPALKGEAPAGGARSRMSRGLVVAQMALSIVLLIASGIFLRNLRAATTIDKGFDSGNLMLASVSPELQGYDRARASHFFDQLTERLRASPNVVAVGLADAIPLSLGSQDSGVEIPGYAAAPDEPMSIDYNIVTPGYFEAMGIPLLKGRGFTARDDSAAPRVVVVNEHFARRFWKDGDAVGKTVRNGGDSWTVVGVVPTGKYRRLGEDPLAFIYYPHQQRWRGAMTVHVRTRGAPTEIIPVLRNEVAALDPDLPLSNVRTMQDFLGTALLPARLAGVVLGVFGLLGLGLACVGIYGVMSYSVAQRTREIGIRMAVGAAHGQVIRLVLRQGMSLVATGAVIGIAAALGVSQLVRGLLYGQSAIDPVAFGAVPVVLMAVALVATLIPARRAARVQPVRALKSE